MRKALMGSVVGILCAFALFLILRSVYGYVYGAPRAKFYLTPTSVSTLVIDSDSAVLEGFCPDGGFACVTDQLRGRYVTILVGKMSWDSFVEYSSRHEGHVLYSGRTVPENIRKIFPSIRTIDTHNEILVPYRSRCARVGVEFPVFEEGDLCLISADGEATYRVRDGAFAIVVHQ